MRNIYYLVKALIKKNVPVYIHYAVTHRCNLKCKMCSVWKNANKNTELKIEDIKKLAKLLRKIGAVNISIGGGEPFLREDLPEIISAFKSNNLRVRVLTNGVASTPEKIHNSIKAGLDDISISLDSLNPELQAKIDGLKNSWFYKMQTFSLFSKFLPKRGNLPIINTVVSSYNYRELPLIAKFANHIQFYVSFIPIHLAPETEKIDRFRNYAPDMEFKSFNQQLIDIYKTILKLKKQNKNIINSSIFLRNSTQYLFNKSVHWKCHAGALYFSISPDGYFTICHDFEGKNGIFFQDFLSYYHSDSFKSDRLNQIKHCSNCFRPCWAEVSYMFSSFNSLFEFIKLNFKANLVKRKQFSTENLIELADNLRKNVIY